MSLYYVQKFLYQLNRDARVRKRFDADFDSVINDYDLADDEIDAMRAALRQHGPVRAGIYAVVRE